MRRRTLLPLLVLAFAPLAARAEGPAFKADLPVLVTSAGQSLAGFTVKTVMTRNGIANDYKPLASAAEIANYRTLVIAFGASVKGFGAAGITSDSEMARTRAIIQAARAAKIALIGVHIGGAEARGGLSQAFVDYVAPSVDYLVVWDDGNADGFFTTLAREKSLPLTVVRQPLEVGQVLKPVFGK